MNKIRHYIDVAKEFAKRSPDSQTKIGSILVHKESGAVLGMSFNGFVRGAPDAQLPTTRPDKYFYMQHSEVNLIYAAAAHGVKTSDCFVVCTHSPCPSCIRAMWQSSIDTIYFDEYHDSVYFDLKDIDIELYERPYYNEIKLSKKYDN